MFMWRKVVLRTRVSLNFLEPSFIEQVYKKNIVPADQAKTISRARTLVFLSQMHGRRKEELWSQSIRDDYK